MLEYLRTRLQALHDARAALVAAADSTLATARAESRDLTDVENDAFRAAQANLSAHDATTAEVAENLRAAEVADQAARANADTLARAGAAGTGEPAHRSPARVGNEPTTYQRGGRNSYFRDLTAVNLNRPGVSAAMERLQRNDREVEVGLTERALTTVDGAGGEFVPPLWLVDEFVGLARAGRVTADLCRHLTLPPGTDTISLPKVTGGTATAEQATQNTAVQNTDATTSSVSAAVTTIAGQQVVAVQLIEQSPVNVDEVLLMDLAADYATKVDTFVLNNNAANKRGLLNVSGIVAVTYTDATPTVTELYPKVADSIQQVHTSRFMPPTAIVMHPRRWAWFLAAVDSSGRPFVTPYAPQNALAAQDGVAAQGPVGSLQGLPVYVDPNVPINLGAGTNEDRILAVRFEDVQLYEGSVRSEAFRETKADQLSVLLRVYNYLALHSERYPKSIAAISGTGLITPTF